MQQDRMGEVSKAEKRNSMKRTTIETDSETLGLIKLYSNYYKYNQRDIVRKVFMDNPHFSKFVRAVKKLNV